MSMQKAGELIKSLMETSSTISKENQLVEYLTQHGSDKTIPFLTNEIIPKPQALGIGKAKVSKAVSIVTGADMPALTKQHGSVSMATYHAFLNKPNTPNIFGDLIVLPSPSTIQEMIISATKMSKEQDIVGKLTQVFKEQPPVSAMAISHFILEDLSVGFSDKIFIKAVARYKEMPNSKIEEAYLYTNSFTKLISLNPIEINQIISAGVVLGQPIKPMLCETLEKVTFPSISQRKLDGNRIHLHILSPTEFRMFSRKMEDVTASHPDLKEAVSQFYQSNVSYMPCILDGEVLTGGKFTDGMTRFRRKHDIEKFAEEFPVTINVFDVFYISGKSIADTPLEMRLEILNKLNFNNKIINVPHTTINSEEEMFEHFNQCLSENFEGTIIKDPHSTYDFNHRGSEWQKLKPSYTFDLICYGGNYGTNKNKDVMSSINLKTVEGLELGKCAGIDEANMAEITKRITNGQQFVVEVVFESLQKGETTSGYSLRFPRFICIRDDKLLSEANSIKDILKCKRT